MKAWSRIVVAGLLALTAVVLGMNIHYLYTTPVANTWVWWIGDETWLMAQCNQFVHTGHYINPLAPGSAFSRCSGLLFGSSYLTAAMYGLPSLFMKGHTIATGRTISFLCSILTLAALWVIANRYRVGPVLCAFGCLLLASTICFFIMSHSARSDMLIGFTILILTGCLPLIIKQGNVNRSTLLLLLGLLIPLTLLVNGHVLILSLPMLVYVIWHAGGFKSMIAVFQWVSAAGVGFLALLILQWVLLGSVSVFGPFSGSSVMMPIMHLSHPKTDIANLKGRLDIANTWASGMLYVSCVSLGGLLWARFHFKMRWSQMETEGRLVITGAGIVILSSVLLEFYWNRYLIYVLPVMVLFFLILLSHVIRSMHRSSIIALAVALTVCLVFPIFDYAREAAQWGVTGETITTANEAAVRDALAKIHSMHTGIVRVYSTVPGEYVAMDDSCVLITPVMFVEPLDTMLSRQEMWQRANINYAIVCDAGHRNKDWNDIDSHLYAPSEAKAKLIFQRVGPFSDIGRATYDPADLRALDTLRVYEFK